MFKLGLAICIGWILIAILAPLLVPYHPITHQNMAGLSAPSAQHGWNRQPWQGCV